MRLCATATYKYLSYITQSMELSEFLLEGEKILYVVNKKGLKVACTNRRLIMVKSLVNEFKDVDYSHVSSIKMEKKYNYDFLKYGAILFIVGGALRLMSSSLSELSLFIDIPKSLTYLLFLFSAALVLGFFLSGEEELSLHTSHDRVSLRVSREHAQKISKIIRGERIGL